MIPRIHFVKTGDNATIPTKGSKEAAGFDLYAAENKCILAGKHDCVTINIAMEIYYPYPPGNYVEEHKYYGRIAPRSGLAAKFGINVGAGVIDSDYRGTIGVVLFNHGSENFDVKIGDRIAQLIPTLYLNCPGFEISKLTDTKRGSDGFGSTGK